MLIFADLCLSYLVPPGTKHRGSSGAEAEGTKLKNVEMTEHGGAYDMGSVNMEDDGETKGETKEDEKANAV
jgi:hypothetical protein